MRLVFLPRSVELNKHILAFIKNNAERKRSRNYKASLADYGEPLEVIIREDNDVGWSSFDATLGASLLVNESNHVFRGSASRVAAFSMRSNSSMVSKRSNTHSVASLDPLGKNLRVG